MKNFITTIKKEYLKEKLLALHDKGYFIEYKEKKDFWTKRLQNLSFPCIAIFLCGQETYKFITKGFEEIETPAEVKNVITTDRCYAIYCSD